MLRIWLPLVSNGDVYIDFSTKRIFHEFFRVLKARENVLWARIVSTSGLNHGGSRKCKISFTSGLKMVALIKDFPPRNISRFFPISKATESFLEHKTANFRFVFGRKKELQKMVKN